MAAHGEPTVVADIREEFCGIPAELERLGARVAIRRLVAGDYMVGTGALVERKRVRDLHLSLVGGRLFRQLGDVRTSCRMPYLLVEGLRIDAGPLPVNAVRGALLAAADLGVTVLRSESADDSALWLLRLAARRQRSDTHRNGRPLYAQRPQARPDHVPEAILAAIPTISTGSARALLNEFGSVEAVLTASSEELMCVPGIGAERVRRLKEAVTRSRSAYRSRRSRD
jgi:DNA excision repair protein ERCC-4